MIKHLLSLHLSLALPMERGLYVCATFVCKCIQYFLQVYSVGKFFKGLGRNFRLQNLFRYINTNQV